MSNQIFYQGDTYGTEVPSARLTDGTKLSREELAGLVDLPANYVDRDGKTILRVPRPEYIDFYTVDGNGTSPLKKVELKNEKGESTYKYAVYIPNSGVAVLKMATRDRFTDRQLEGLDPLPTETEIQSIQEVKSVKSLAKVNSVFQPLKAETDTENNTQTVTLIPQSEDPEVLTFFYGDELIEKEDGQVHIPVAESLIFYYGDKILEKRNGEIHIPEPEIPDELEFKMANREDFSEDQLSGETELPKENGVVKIPKAVEGVTQSVEAEKNQVLIGNGEEWIEGSPFYTQDSKMYPIDSITITSALGDQVPYLSSIQITNLETEESIDIIRDFFAAIDEEITAHKTEWEVECKTEAHDYIENLLNDSTNYYYIKGSTYILNGNSYNTYWTRYPNGSYAYSATKTYELDIPFVINNSTIKVIVTCSIRATVKKNGVSGIYTYADMITSLATGQYSGITIGNNTRTLKLGNDVSFSFSIKNCLPECTQYEVKIIGDAIAYRGEAFYSGSNIIIRHDDEDNVYTIGPKVRNHSFPNRVKFKVDIEKDDSGCLSLGNKALMVAEDNSRFTIKNHAWMDIANDAQIKFAHGARFFMEDAAPKFFMHGNVEIDIDDGRTSGNGQPYPEGNANSNGFEFGAKLRLHDSGIIEVSKSGYIGASNYAKAYFNGKGTIRVGGTAESYIISTDGKTLTRGLKYSSPEIYFNNGLLHFGSFVNDSYNYNYSTNTYTKTENPGTYPQVFINSGYITFNGDDTTGEPVVAINGASTFIMNGRKDISTWKTIENGTSISREVKDLDPGLILNPSSFVYVGQLRKGTGEPNLSNAFEGVFGGPIKNITAASRTRNPRIQIADDTEIIIDAGGTSPSSASGDATSTNQWPGTNYIKIGAGWNQNLEIFITGNSFIQHSGNSHFEIHDDAYLAMDCDLYNQAVLKFGSSNNTSNTSVPPGNQLFPFTIRNVRNVIGHLYGLDERKTDNLISVKAPVGIYISDAGTSGFTLSNGGTVWTLTNLQKLMTGNSSSNDMIYSGGVISEVDGQKYLGYRKYQYDSINKQSIYTFVPVSTIELNTSSLTLMIGKNLRPDDDSAINCRKIWVANTLKWGDSFSINCSPYDLDEDITSIKINFTCPYMEHPFYSQEISKITLIGFSTQAPTKVRNEEYFQTGYNTSDTRYIGWDNFGGIISEDYTSANTYQGQDFVLGSSTRLGNLEDPANPGFLTFGYGTGIRMWAGSADKMSFKCVNQEFTTLNSKIFIKSNSTSLTVKDGSSLLTSGSSSIEFVDECQFKMSGKASVNFDKDGTFYMGSSGILKIYNGANVDIRNGSTISMTDATSISMKEGSSINLATSTGIALFGGSSKLKIDQMQIIADYSTEKVIEYNEETGEDIIKEVQKGQITINSYCNGDKNEGEAFSSVTFTFDELKALKALLS